MPDFYEVEFEKKFEKIEKKIDSMNECLIKLQAQFDERGIWLSKILNEIINNEKNYREFRVPKKTGTKGEE